MFQRFFLRDAIPDDSPHPRRTRHQGGGSTKKIEALEAIRRAEEETAALLEQARKEKEKILFEAKRAAMEIQERSRRDADGEYARILEDEKKKARAEREEILARGREVARVHIEKSEGRIEGAIRLLKERVEEELDNV